MTVELLSKPVPAAPKAPLALRSFNAGAPIGFVHVMKAAGTTVRLVLENAFSGDMVYPTGSPLFAGRYIPLKRGVNAGDDLTRYRLLSGHFGVVAGERLDRDANLFTWLREPGDRVTSEFFYFVVQERLEGYQPYIDRMDAGERAEEVFLDWLHDVPPDFHPQMSQLVSGIRLNYPDWRKAHPDTRLADAAVDALSRCFFIGLMEDQERSLDALCALTGILPPRSSPKRNPGTRRPEKLRFTTEEQARFDAQIAPDRAFYALALQVYDRQMADLAARGRTDPALALIGDRAALRAHLLEHAAADAAPLKTWSAWDPVLGENLDGREELRSPGAVASRWRWTASRPDTFLHFRLPRRTFELTIRLNPATPPHHAEGATLRLSGTEVPLAIAHRQDGRIDLTAMISWRLARRLPKVSELHLHTAVMLDESKLVPHAGTRMLGLAIESIHARPMGFWELGRRKIGGSRFGRLARRIAVRPLVDGQ